MRSQPPDVILHSGHILTVDAAFSRAEAIAITGNKITAVGTDSEVKGLADARTRLRDLKGVTVIPGMTDNHTHQLLAGLDRREVGAKVDISLAQSIEAIKAIIKDEVGRRPPGEWVGTSCMYRGSLTEGRFPTRHDLDEVAPDNPVYVFQSGKNVIVNTEALRLAGIDESTPDPALEDGFSEGKIVRDSNGRATGHLIAGAADLARRRWWQLYDQAPKMWDFLQFDIETYSRAIKAQMKVFNSAGITAVRDMGLSMEEIQAYLDLRRRNDMTLRTDILLGIPARYMTIEDVDRAIRHYFGPPQGIGDDWLRIGGLKVVIQNDGWWALSPEKVRVMLTEGNKRGWCFAIHAASGFASEQMRQIIDNLEEIDREKPLAGRRFTLEHGYGLIEQDTHRRIARLGIIVAANLPLSYYAAARTFEMHEAMDEAGMSKEQTSDAWARTVVEWGLPIRDWINQGIVVTSGTDCPAITYDPERPLLTLYTACTQETLAGRLMPGQETSREEALRMATINNAYAMWQEDIRGSIEAGKLADLVVLSADVMTVSDEELLQTRVHETMVDGQTVYEA